MRIALLCSVVALSVEFAQLDGQNPRQTPPLTAESGFSSLPGVPWRAEAVAQEIDATLKAFAQTMLSGGNGRAATGLRKFADEMRQLTAGYHVIRTASFRVISIDASGNRPRAIIAGEIAGEGQNRGPRQDLCQWESSWTREDIGWILTNITTKACSQQTSTRPLFEEITAAALGSNTAFHEQFGRGIGEWADHLDGASGIDFYGLNGVSAGDYDGDGWDDFYICQPGGLPGRLFSNRRDGTFKDVTAAVGLQLLDATSSALFGDYDNDGDQDLFLITASGILLFEADGRGHFTRSIRARFEVPVGEQGLMMMGALADYDRDGFLDLYACSYSLRGSSGMATYLHQPTPYFDANNGAPNQLFRNNGNGTFTNVTAKSKLSMNNTRWSFAASWADYNLDGYPDLYVANDFGRSNLYRNNGDGTFADVAAQAGVENIGPGMSAAWGDFDNDGRDDLYISNIWSAAGQRVMALPEFQPAAPPAVRDLMHRFSRGNSLYRNRPDGRFDYVGDDAANGGWAWGSDFLDADNDGWEDLFIVNGHITNDRDEDLESFHWTDVVGTSPVEAIRSKSYEEGWRRFQNRMNVDGLSVQGKERKRFYRNTGSGRFVDFSAPSGLDFEDDGRAFAAVDFDNDGDLDLLIKNRTAPQVRVLQNTSISDNRSVAFELIGRNSNRDAVGARVTFALDGKTRTKEVRSGSGFLSQHTRRIYFGVGQVRELPAIRIDWPSGLSQRFERVPTGAIIRIEEGRSGFVVRAFRRSGEPPSGREAIVAAGTPYRGTWLVEPVKMPNLQLADSTGKARSVFSELLGSPVVVNVSANRCEACEKERSEWAKLRGKLDRQPIVFIAADGTVGGGSYTASPTAIRLLNTVTKNLFARRRDMTLPYTLLLDRRVHIVKIYRGSIKWEWIAEDVRQLPWYDRDHKSMALPFPGQYHGSMGSRLESYFLMGLESLQDGSYDDALVHFNLCLRLDSGIAAIHSNIGSTRARKGQIEEAMAAFQRAAQLDPQSADIQFNIGTTLAMAGRYREAAAALEQASKMDPGAAETWTNLGNVYLDMDQPALARAQFERALELKPGSAVIHNSLGTLYHQQKRPDLARKHFEEAIRLQPNYDAAYLNLGLLYLHQQDRVQAAAMFRKALELKPASVEARRLLERSQ